MQSSFKRTVSVRVVLAASVLALASCSDSGGSGGGGLVPAEDEVGNTTTSPFGEQPVDTQPLLDETPVGGTPVDETPIDETPIDETPIDETPIDETPIGGTPPVAPTAGASGFESLYGRATFEADFIDSSEILRFFATFSADNLVNTDDGGVLLASTDTGIYEAFVCESTDNVQSEVFLCAGIFDGSDINLFGFELADGVGLGIFEECFGAEATNFDACFDDFLQSPDGTLTVSIESGLAAAQASESDSVLSASEFHAMMESNGQATRFATPRAGSTDAERALIARGTQLLANVQKMLD